MSTLTLGSPIIPFSLPGVDGQEHGPAEGRMTAVVMWCNHCPYVQAWETRLDSIARDHPDLDVVAINANDPDRYPADDLDAMKERATARGFSFAYVQDRSQEIARAYGGERTPHAFLFDPEGRLRYRGAIDDSWEEENARTAYLRDAIDAIRSGRDPDPAETPAVGCTIKWRQS
jgi:hypothetical protein